MTPVTTMLAKRMGYLSEEPAAEPAGLLAGILDYAYENVPYYREIFERAGVVRNGRVDLERFTEVPFLDKPTLKARSEDLISRSIDRKTTYWNTSGGSTGEPVSFYLSRARKCSRAAATVRHNRWAGWEVGDRAAVIWGAARDRPADTCFEEPHERP